MSYAATEWALDHPGARGTAKLVLIAIANRADRGGNCYPSISGIAKRIGMCRRSVGMIINDLVAAGLVVRREREGEAPLLHLVGFADGIWPNGGAPTEPSTGVYGRAQSVRGGDAGNALGREGVAQGGRADIAQEGAQSSAATCAAVAPEPVREPSKKVSPPYNPPPPSPTAKPKRKSAPAQASIELPLPAWLPRAQWDDFVKHRSETRCPLTETAARLLLGKLEAWYREGWDIASAIEDSIAKGYRGVFAPRTRRSDAPQVELYNGKPLSAFNRPDPVLQQSL